MAEESGIGVEIGAVEGGADLGHFADGDEVGEFFEAEVLEGVGTAGAAEGLDFVHDDEDAGFAEAFHDGFEEGGVARVESAFALDEFDDHSGVIVGVGLEELIDGLEGFASGILGAFGIEEGDVIDFDSDGESFAVFGAVGDLAGGHGATSERALEGEETRSGGFVLEGDFEGVFVGHGSAGGEETVGEAGAGLVGEVDELAAEFDGVGVHLEIALHDGVGQGGVDSGFDEAGVGMAEDVDADAADEVHFDGAVGEFDEGAVADAAAEVGEVEGAASDIRGFGGLLLVGFGVLGIGGAWLGEVGRVLGDGVEEELFGLLNSGVLEEFG